MTMRDARQLAPKVNMTGAESARLHRGGDHAGHRGLGVRGKPAPGWQRAGHGVTITGPQIGILHVAMGRFGWDADGCRQALVRIAGVTTSKGLDQAGFEAVTGFAARCGFQPLGKGAAQHYGNRPGMASYALPGLIRRLWRELHGQRECDDAVGGRVAKYHKVSGMRFLTLDGAHGDCCAQGAEGATEGRRGLTRAAKDRGAG